jgi:hypothetical protein
MHVSTGHQPVRAAGVGLDPSGTPLTVHCAVLAHAAGFMQLSAHTAGKRTNHGRVRGG